MIDAETCSDIHPRLNPLEPDEQDADQRCDEFHKEDFGKETRPTLFMHHRQNRPYHVDYCFASRNFKVSNVEVGNFKDWIGKSDHMPIIVTFDEG